MTQLPHDDYPVLIARLPPGDGGGYVATVPDLPGCMADGITREQAAHHVAEALVAWIGEARALGREVPTPGSAPLFDGAAPTESLARHPVQLVLTASPSGELFLVALANDHTTWWRGMQPGSRWRLMAPLPQGPLCDVPFADRPV